MVGSEAGTGPEPHQVADRAGEREPGLCRRVFQNRAPGTGAAHAERGTLRPDPALKPGPRRVLRSGEQSARM